MAEGTQPKHNLESVARLLYGPRWQVELAADSGVSTRTVRRWHRHPENAPAWVYHRLVKLSADRRAACEKAAAMLAAPGFRMHAEPQASAIEETPESAKDPVVEDPAAAPASPIIVEGRARLARVMRTDAGAPTITGDKAADLAVLKAYCAPEMPEGASDSAWMEHVEWNAEKTQALTAWVQRYGPRAENTRVDAAERMQVRRADAKAQSLDGIGFDGLRVGDVIEVKYQGGERTARIVDRKRSGTLLYSGQQKGGAEAGKWHNPQPLDAWRFVRLIERSA